MPSRSEIDFKFYYPLLGNEYFFPDSPLGGRIQLEGFPDILIDSDDEDNSERCYATKLIPISSPREYAEYPDSVPGKVIDSCNFDVISFLSTDKRDYLVRNYKNGHQVNVQESLRGKLVMICCFLAPTFSYSRDSRKLRAVSLACSELYNRCGDGIEIVLVVKMIRDFEGDPASFRHFLSGFPSNCLVLPFWDSESRDSICKSVGLTNRPKGLFVLPENMVLWHKNLDFFEHFGIDTFPFTDYLITATEVKENSTPLESWSLEFLLACEPSTVIGKNPGGGLETVSISQLKGKLVGLYLCYTGEFIPMLDQVYKGCRDRGMEFEIVVVYVPFHTRNSDPKLFQKQVNRALVKRNISWWVVPFTSWVSRRLFRFRDVEGNFEEPLVILGPNGEFVDPYGESVIRHFGINAYPFSRGVMFHREVQRIRAITLESLLIYGPRNYVLGKDGETKHPLGLLRGRNIILCVDYDPGCPSERIVGPLSKYYEEIKQRDPDFEVVYVHLHASSVYGVVNKLPGLVCPFDPDHSDFVSKEIFGERDIGTLVAFDKTGHICSIWAHKHLSSQGVKAYPFYGVNMLQEVIDVFSLLHHRVPRGKFYYKYCST